MAKTKVKQTESVEFKLIDATILRESLINPRKHFNENALSELADSIKQKGILQPIVVREIDNMYEVVCGARRFRAGNIAGIKEFPCVIRQLTDNEALELMITENLQRADVHPMEEANAILALQKSGLSNEDIAIKLGKTANFVTLRIKLLDLIPEIQEAFLNGILKPSDALKLSRLGKEDQQDFFESNIEGETELVQVPDYHIRNYTNNLSHAKFDINDADLTSAGPCTTCIYNSAHSTIIFPDQQNKMTCNNKTCWHEKEDAHNEVFINKCITEGIPTICNSYYEEPRMKDVVSRLSEYNIPFIKRNDYCVIEAPEEMTKEEWLEDNYDVKSVFEIEDLEERDVARQEWEDYLQQLKDEKDEYEQSINDAIEVNDLYSKKKVFILKHESTNNIHSESSNETNIEQKINRNTEIREEKIMFKLQEINTEGCGISIDSAGNLMKIFFYLKASYSLKHDFEDKLGYRQKAEDFDKVLSLITDQKLNEFVFNVLSEAFVGFTTGSLSGFCYQELLKLVGKKDEVMSIRIELEEKYAQKEKKLLEKLNTNTDESKGI